MRILLIEDHVPLCEGLATTLREDGWIVDTAYSLTSARRILRAEILPCAIILDRCLPDGDGVELLVELRQKNWLVPVLLLTSRDAIADRVEGLNAGADDYLIKPFAVPELLARLRGILRRNKGCGSAKLVLSDLEIDTATKEASRSGRRIELSPKEYLVLEHLVLHQGRVVTRRDLWDQIYDDHCNTVSNVLDVLVSRLRNKIGNPPLIHTRRGQGFIAAGVEDRS